MVNYKLGERTSDGIGRISCEVMMSKFVRLIKQIRLIGVKGLVRITRTNHSYESLVRVHDTRIRSETIESES